MDPHRTTLAFAESDQHLVVSTIDTVLRNARLNYRIRKDTPGTGAVDFHLLAATQTRDTFASAVAVDGVLAIGLSAQQREALDKILLNHRLRVTPEWKKRALAVRKVINATASDTDSI